MNQQDQLPKQTKKNQSADDSIISDVVESRRKHQGFLPIKTNLFDRVFISIVCLVAIHLLWLRFLEYLLPLWIATMISLVISYVIVRYG